MHRCLIACACFMFASCTLSRDPHPEPCKPEGAETCNGNDDDCDGTVDEHPVDARFETCNGVDDDCDGVVDEPLAEMCNGVDDDCDGDVDEAGSMPNDARNCGACGNVCEVANATTACMNGTCTIATCEDGFTDIDERYGNGCEQRCTGDETCNDADDDCDGAIDEFVVGDGCMPPIVEIAPGGVYTCARREDGAVFCWGANDYGQLGIGTTVGRPSPVRVPDLNAQQISSGKYHTCALREGGEVSCWGDNTWGEVTGVGNAQKTPFSVEELEPTASLGLGFYHSCVVTEGGEVVCWGLNGHGQTGASSSSDVDVQRTPRTVPGVSDVVQVDGGWRFTCARHTNGTVSCWGDNDGGQLGDGTTTSRYTAALVETEEGDALDDVTSMSVSARHVCVLQRAEGESDGRILCWGSNAEGALGVETENPTVTSPIALGIDDPVEVSTGVFFSCARRQSGDVFCWGRNDSGQLGIGSRINSVEPVLVIDLESALQLHVDNGDYHACAVRDDFAVVCWGKNDQGQLGIGRTSDPMLSPTRVPGI